MVVESVNPNPTAQLREAVWRHATDGEVDESALVRIAGYMNSRPQEVAHELSVYDLCRIEESAISEDWPDAMREVILARQERIKEEDNFLSFAFEEDGNDDEDDFLSFALEEDYEEDCFLSFALEDDN